MRCGEGMQQAATPDQQHVRGECKVTMCFSFLAWLNALTKPSNSWSAVRLAWAWAMCVSRDV